MNIRRAIIIAVAVVMTTIGLAAPANATWTWSGGSISATSLEASFELMHPEAFVVAAASGDALGCQSYGGKVYNSVNSTWGVALGTGCTNNGVPPGHWSNEYLNSRDVDSFYVGVNAYCTDLNNGNTYTTGWWKLVGDLSWVKIICKPRG